MSPDLTAPPINTHTEAATELLVAAWDALNDAKDTATAAACAAMAQAHATLAAAQETHAAAYDTKTAAYVNYYAALPTNTHSEQQHAAVVDKLIRDRLGFTPAEEAAAPNA